MVDGLWTAEFGSSTGVFGGGVAVFRDGKILGGDATYYYVGDYLVSGKEFKATLRVSPYMEGAQSVFGTVGKSLTLELEGSFVDERQLIAKGRAREVPTANFGAKLVKRT